MIDHVEFALISSEEIRRASVVEVTETSLYNRGFPRDNGLSDLRMGTTDRRFRCSTCKKRSLECPGHFGHIHLTEPVVHSLYIDTTLKILRSVCFWCSAALSRETFPSLSSRATACKMIKACPKCGGKQQDYAKFQGLFLRKRLTAPRDEFDSDAEHQEFNAPLKPDKIRQILQYISPEDCRLLRVHDPVSMVLQDLLVPPPAIRPTVGTGVKSRGNDLLTCKLQEILKFNIALRKQPSAKNYELLASSIASYFDKDSSTARARSGGGRSVRSSPVSIVNRLKGKRGRLRGHIQGKRVDFSARSVITADACLDLNRVGIPKHIALRQTIPETATPANIQSLRARVLAGSGVLEGAMNVVIAAKEDGRKMRYRLDLCNYMKRKEIAASLREDGRCVVERYLQNGDYVIVNRQPTLWRGSMMAHSAKIMPEGLTIRLPVSSTTSYNADFDGDEMNVHVVQSEEGRQELASIMSVENMILSNQKNSPIMGCVQDTVTALYLLTCKSTLLTRSEFMNLALKIRYGTSSATRVEPAILRPEPLYTGKQVFSLMCADINMVKRTRSLRHSDFMDRQERHVVIEGGKLLSGRCDKKITGPSSGGAVHITCLDCTANRAQQFISDCQRVGVAFLHLQGFSCGLADCVPPETLAELDGNRILGEEDLSAALDEGEISLRLQNVLNKVGQSVSGALLPGNRMQTMVASGAKGSVLNLSQIHGMVGQQSVCGKRIGDAGKRTLSCFAMDDRGPKSKGFITSSYSSGLNPAEFFFHQMAAREGLCDTAVKTSLSGYIQRKIQRMLENNIVQQDFTVRNGTKVVQYSYGGSNTASKYAEKNYLREFDMTRMEILDRHGYFYGEKIIARMSEFVRVKRIYTPLVEGFVRLPVNIHRIIQNSRGGGGERKAPQRRSRGSPFDLKETLRVGKTVLGPLFPLFELATICHLSPRRVKELGLAEPEQRAIFSEIQAKLQRAVVPRGEAVGALAAASVGEPTTQMTLNTFHHSGIAAKNVTLGIPRVKELLDASKTLRTPSATLHLRVGGEKTASHIASKLYPVFVQDVVQGRVEVIEGGDELFREKDRDLLEFYSHFRKGDAPVTAAAPVIRLQMDRGKLQKHSISFREVVQGLIQIQNARLEHDEETRVVRISIQYQELKVKKASKQAAVNREFARQLLETRVRGVEGVDGATVRRVFETSEGDGGFQSRPVHVIDTDGSNLLELAKIPGVSTRSFTNNVHEMNDLYGIECARTILYRELVNCLCFDGSYINSVHPLLLTATMTQEGFYCPVSRHGFSKMKSNPLMRACFEQTSDVFLKAAVKKASDGVIGVSERIMFGAPVPCGTGLVEIEVQRAEKEEQPAASAEKTDKTEKAETGKGEFIGRRKRGRAGRLGEEVGVDFRVNLATLFAKFCSLESQAKKQKLDCLGYPQEKRSSFLWREGSEEPLARVHSRKFVPMSPVRRHKKRGFVPMSPVRCS